MNPFTAEELIEVTGGRLLSGDLQDTFRNLTTDSREIPEDALFVPIAGETMDGHRFIGSALDHGAKAVLTAQEAPVRAWMAEHPTENRIIVLVDDTLTAVQKVGAAARAKLPLRAVGVTGSVGKTTTREMIAAALSSERKVARTGKNFNNKLGVPITLCGLSEEDELAVLELGLNVPDELGTISSLCDLSCAVITNIGVAHMEYYGNQDRLTEEKMTVTRGFYDSRKEEKTLFLCGDDAQLVKYRDYTGYPTVLYGTGENCRYRAVNVHPSDGCYAFDFMKDGEILFPVLLGVPGAHNVLNACAALAVSDFFGVDLKKAAEALSQYGGFKGRLQRIVKDGVVYIDDTYNASPDSMKAGLSVLSEMAREKGGRKIAVLGDMLELGEDSARFHYEVGSYAAEKLPDLVYLCGEESKQIEKALADAGYGARTKHYEALDELKRALEAEIRQGDIVYFKASHSMHFAELLEEILRDE